MATESTEQGKPRTHVSMLERAEATKELLNGMDWYGGEKTTEELLKAILVNQLAIMRFLHREFAIQ